MGLLENKVGIVTGAGQGIGRAIASRCAAEGASVVVADFNQEMGEQTVELIRAAGGEATFAFGDVSDEASVKAMIKTVLKPTVAWISPATVPPSAAGRARFTSLNGRCSTRPWKCA